MFVLRAVIDLNNIIPKGYDARVQPPTDHHKSLEIHTKLTIYGVLEVRSEEGSALTGSSLSALINVPLTLPNLSLIHLLILAPHPR